MKVAEGSVLIVGGTAGLGREVARHYQSQGAPVIITGRDPRRSAEVAVFLLENRALNGVNLYVDGGWMLM